MAANLVECSLQYSHHQHRRDIPAIVIPAINSDSYDASFAPVSLVPVKKLRLLAPTDPALLDSLALPSLDDLSVIIHISHLQRLNALITRSACRITRLYVRLRGCGMDVDVVSMLANVPMLSHLTLAIPRTTTNTLLGEMSIGVDGGGIVPRLECLTLEGISSLFGELVLEGSEVFITMIRSRMGLYSHQELCVF